MKYIITLPMIFWLATGLATTWVKSTVDDPIKPGEKCNVSEPASYGNYIYHWPSKYDQVFWPYTDPHSIWYCEGSGYISFMADFEELTDTEKSAIRKYLSKKSKTDLSPKERLQRLEEIYGLRNLEPEYQNQLLRVFARWHQGLKETEKANKYREQAYSGIQKALSEQLPEHKRLEYLYLAANYSKLLNEPEKSKEYLEKLKAAIKNLEDPELTGFSEYLEELSSHTKYIQPGGILDPEVPESSN